MKTIYLEIGSHPADSNKLCLMEAAAYLAGEPHSDQPKCACPVITKLGIWLNDNTTDAERQELCGDLPWRIVGTKSTPDIERQRAYMAADWAVRVVAPIALRSAGLEAEAKKLESLPVVDGCKAAAEAAEAAARAAARAAEAAAWAAAWAAEAAARAAEAAARAAEAAWAAAWAAEAAARAAEAAARAAEAAWAAWAAEAAARAAARAEIKTCLRDLLIRMIELTEVKESIKAMERANV